MSAICFMNFNAKLLTFEQLNKLANDFVKNAIKNNFAVSFNDCYADRIISECEYKTTVTISNSFIYRHADDLLDLSEFAYETDSKYKKIFMHRYKIFSKLAEIAFGNGITEVDFYITEDGNCKLDSYILIETNKDKVVEDLYNCFIEQSEKTGYTFPDLKIHIVKH